MFSHFAALPRVSTQLPPLPANLDGRFMTSQRVEHICRAIGVSADHFAIECVHKPGANERVILYLDHCGRFEGPVIRLFSTGFVMSVEATARRREKLATLFTHMSQRDLLSDRAFRQYERLIPLEPRTTITLDEAVFPADIIDISRKGAALKTPVKVVAGAKVTLGRATKAEVVRGVDDGFAVQFMRLLPLESFDENIVL